MDLIGFDLCFVVCAALLLCYLFYTNRCSGHKLPPGPKGLPLIGNLLDLPTGEDKAWETYGKWAKEYGDIMHIRSFGSSIIIINSLKVAIDLLEKRSSIYSDRPRVRMLDLMKFFGTGAVPYGSTWRKHRTHYHKQLSQAAAREFQPRQSAAAQGLLRLILESPQDYQQHIRHMAADVVMSIAYGYDIAPKADPFVALGERLNSSFSEAARPGAFMIELIPMLKHVPEWFPGAGFRKFARDAEEDFRDAKNLPFENVRRQLSAGKARPSFVANALMELENYDDSNEEVEVIKGVAGSIYGAGADTTVSSILSFILAMVLHPDVQRTAQAELDTVIGRDRLPEFSDRHNLPYISAVVKEALRYHTVLPTGLPHASIADDIYEGYHIPKGAVVIGNTWAMLHDPEIYPDPFTFRPERFLQDKDGNVARDPAITGAFGFGRRICAGRHLAEPSVWIAIVSLLAAFEISHATDDHGRPIDVRYALDPSPGVLIHPRPFPCSIKPRTPEIEVLIRQSQQTSENGML